LPTTALPWQNALLLLERTDDGVGGVLLDHAVLVKHLELLCRVSTGVQHDGFSNLGDLAGSP